MAYENLKSAIKQAIKQNGNQEITGNLLQSTLLNVVNTIGADYKFLGLAMPSTVPPTSEECRLFYFASGAGEYINFTTTGENTHIITEEGLYLFTKEANSEYWRVNDLVEIVQTTGKAEDKVMSQKAITLRLHNIEYYDNSDNTEVINATGYYLYSKEHDFSVPSMVKVELSNVESYDVQVYLSKSNYSQVDIKELAVIKAGDSAAEIYDVVSEEHKYIGVAVASGYTGTVSITVVSNTNDSFDKKIKTSEEKIEEVDTKFEQNFRTQQSYNVIDGSIDYDTGIYNSYLGENRWGCVQDIEVLSGDNIEVVIQFPVTKSLLCTYCIKDKNKNVIKGGYLFGSFDGKYTKQLLVIPENGAYVSFSFFRYEYDDVFSMVNKTMEEKSINIKIDKINNSIYKQGLSIASNTSKIGKINDSIEGKPQEEFEIKDGYTNEDGSYINNVGDNNYGTTSYIPCNPGDELTITLTLEEANDLMTWVTCKDVNGNALIDKWKYLHTTFTGTISTTKYIVPNDVYFVSFTFWRYDKGYTFTVINKSNAEGIKKKISNLEQEVDKIKNESQNLSVEPTTLALGSRLVKSEIPSYWFDEVNSDNYEKVGTYLDEKIASVPNGKHFIWITDCHYQGDITDADNRKHSAAIIDYVRRKLNIKTVLHGGDVMQERTTALAAAKDWIAFNDDFVGRLGSDFKQVCGDHDHNAKSGTNPEDAVFTFAFAQKMLTAYNTDNLVFDHIYDEQVKSLGWSDKLMSEYYAYNKMHYYYDDASIGTRFIVLFTGWAKTTFDFMAQTIGNSFEDEEGKCLYPQMDFLYQALMTLPNGYNVVVCGHNVLKATPHDDETAYGGVLSEVTKPLFVGYWHIVANMLRAFMNKTTTSKPIPSVDWSRTDGTYPSKTYDYTKAHNAGIVFSLGGDLHSDMMCKSNAIDNYFYDEPLNLPNGGSYKVGTQMLHIVSISDGTDRGYYLSYPDKLPLAPPATSGTINEQAFDIFTLAEDGIYITRIGAGNDRVVYFE